MGLSLRVRRRGGSKIKEQIPVMEEEITIPPQFQCPISYELMKDPVIVASGITYDRENIDKWFESGNQTCPVTNTVLSSLEQIPNHAIRRMIQGWCVAKGSSLDRIPTPRVPVTSHQVVEVCQKLSSATRRGDHVACGEIVRKIKRLGKESERNKKCVNENGAALVLCVCFDAFAATENALVLEEDILSVLTWTLPIGYEGRARLTSTASFSCLVDFMRNGDENAAVLVKELLLSSDAHALTKALINGVEEALVRSIRDSASSSLTSIYHIISKKPDMVSRFLELDLVNLTVDLLVDSENSVCEKALLVLDAICESKQGREQVRRNELVMPILVKKILKISEFAKRDFVSVMWKLCKTGGGSEVEEALRLGAFKKLVVMLQVGCGQVVTKEKVTELLKMMNKHMKTNGFVQASDSSMEFKHLKKPF